MQIPTFIENRSAAVSEFPQVPQVSAHLNNFEFCFKTCTVYISMLRMQIMKGPANLGRTYLFRCDGKPSSELHGWLSLAARLAFNEHADVMWPHYFGVSLLTKTVRCGSCPSGDLSCFFVPLSFPPPSFLRHHARPHPHISGENVPASSPGRSNQAFLHRRQWC